MIRTRVDENRLCASKYPYVAREFSTKSCERILLDVLAADIQDSASVVLVADIGELGEAAPLIEKGFLNLSTWSKIGRVVRIMH